MARRGRNGKNKPQQNAGFSGGQQSHGSQRGDNKPSTRSEHRPVSPQNHRTSGDAKPQQQGSQSNANKLTFQSALQPRKTLSRGAVELNSSKPTTLLNYKVVFFDTINQAKSDLTNLRSLTSQCDRLNIVVRAEASMEDADLTAIGKLFCGAAWALIHDRRVADGWYNEPHE